MVYRNKGKFVLDVEHLQAIVNDILKQKNNKDVAIQVKESPVKKSKSLYLYISIDGCAICLRLSDHKCKGEVRQIIVGESTGAANVYYKIQRAIRELRYKKLQSVLKGVEYEHKTGKSHRKGK